MVQHFLGQFCVPLAEISPSARSATFHSPAARVFLRFSKLSQHPACMDHAILHGKPFSNPLIQLADNENEEVYILGDLIINLLAQNVSTCKKLQELMELQWCSKV